MNTYRPEIDGLRAIAVVSVILYHAKLSIFDVIWFEGGYLGVDVFFVISGYLITKILVSELDDQGYLNFANFYQRRAKRILPMLLTMMLVSFPFAWALLLPTDLVEYAQSGLSAIFFGSNFFFYFATTEYGAVSSLLKPFLHTWSLGIEEQFYLVFPVILMLVYRYARAHLLAVLGFLLVTSLLLSQSMESRNADLNFYLPFSRFWELLAGSLLAVVGLRYGHLKHPLATNLLPLVGLFLVGYSITVFDGQTPHPGLITLLPILGVSLIIAFSTTHDLTGRLLSTRPMVGLGLISYSAYLWHFPLFAFCRIYDPHASELDKLWWIVATLVLSTASYYLIEKPFRRKLPIRYAAASFIMVVASAVVAVNVAVIVNDGFKERYPSVDNYELDNQALRKQRGELSNQLFLDPTSHYPNADGSNILVVGNSHGEQLAMVMRHTDAIMGQFQVGWLRYRNLASTNGYMQLSCFDHTVTDITQMDERFFTSDLYQGAHLVVIATRYNTMTSRTKMLCESKVKRTVGSDLVGTANLIKRVLADGKRVAVVGNSVEFETSGKPISDELLNQYDVLDVGEINRAHYSYRKEDVFELNKQVREIAEAANVPYWSLTQTLCDVEGEVCFGLDDDGNKLFYDYGHFTVPGIKFYAGRLHEQGFSAWLERAFHGR